MGYYLMDVENGYYYPYYSTIRDLTKYEVNIQLEKFNSTVDIQIEKNN